MTRVVELPDRGRLIVATDLQGNLADFERLASIYEEAAKDRDGAVMVITGDLVHGPEIPEHHWPDYLGSYFRADSAGVIDLAEELHERYPDNVHYLLGNHEHAHVGGPIVSKFFANEALRLERLMGNERAVFVREWLSSWPLIAFSRSARLLMLHAAPNAVLHNREHVENVQLAPPGGADGVVDDTLAEILWARSATAPRAKAFLRTFDKDLRVAVFGHDVVREGYSIDREPLLCLSTSFGCFDGDKLYLDWDLNIAAKGAKDVAKRGLQSLYPDAEAVYRTKGRSV
jgi:hypothetical protein